MKILLWLVCVVGIEITGVISSCSRAVACGVILLRTYAQLPGQTVLAPPGGIIGIVWTILYAFMGTALFLLIIAKVIQHLRNKPILFIWYPASVELFVEYCLFWLESLLGRNSGYRLIGFDSHRLYVFICPNRLKDPPIFLYLI